ncbi:hypothetical protein OUY22_27440 [Nonomuraea sp. MCN248]|uniref:Uncharacterized protein n=1 Tax=Nonomuraea corallina TaxID=2989783 RepID=A0ABT4SIV9_9ACTN|nr:hypothetical protein [Nonomuraea corallina]MDA0637152.1 hypothetical protein [Nonomuraea corallina]
MLPEVKAFFDAIDDQNLRIETDRVYRAHPVPDWDHTMAPDQVEAYFEAEDKRNAAVRELEKAHKAKQAEAYQKLAASEDPLVRFLLTDPEVRAYPQHVHVVLRALPMSREEMEEFGDRQEWCHEFGRLFKHAERAGVLPEPAPDLADIEPLVREAANRFGTNERRLRTLVKKHLPDILASASAKAAQRAPEALPTTA